MVLVGHVGELDARVALAYGIDLQAGRHTPFSREEILMDYLNIGTYRKNYTEVLLVIVNSNAVRGRR